MSGLTGEEGGERVTDVPPPSSPSPWVVVVVVPGARSLKPKIVGPFPTEDAAKNVTPRILGSERLRAIARGGPVVSIVQLERYETSKWSQ